MKRRLFFLSLGLFFAVSLAQTAEDRREKVLKDRTDVQAAGRWIYNDLPAAFAEANRTGKPMLVVIRCIP